MDLFAEERFDELIGLPQRDIFVAIQRNDPQLLREILNCLQEAGFYWLNCIQKKSGRTPLHACARVGNIELMSILCEEWRCPRFNLEVNDYNGKKCLHEAAQACLPRMVEYLIQQGAKIDSLKKGDWTPLMLSCTKVGPEALSTIKALLEGGANIHLKNKDNWTPLHIAVREGDIEIISLLISKGADVLVVTKNGRSLLHIAALNSQAEAMELLLNNYNLPIDCKDSCGITPLLDSAVGGCVNIARMLISKGACKNEVDGMGLTCLHLAAEAGQDDMVKFLVEECRMDVNLQAEGSDLTPYHCADRSGKISTKEILENLGADVHLIAHGGNEVDRAAYGAENEELRYMIEEVFNLFN